MTHTIVLIPGDGIGPEITDAVLRILKSSGVSIAWERHAAGVAAFERTGKALPLELLESFLELLVGPRERRGRVRPGEARRVHDREEQIPQLLVHP